MWPLARRFYTSLSEVHSTSPEKLSVRRNTFWPFLNKVKCSWFWAKSFWQISKSSFYRSNVRFWWNSCFLIETSFLNVVGLWAKSFQQICQNCINCLEERLFYLVGKFILLLSFSRFRQKIFGTFTNQNGRVVKIAIIVFSGTCWGKSSLVEKVYKSSSILDSEQRRTRQVCQKCSLGVNRNILKENMFF